MIMKLFSIANEVFRISVLLYCFGNLAGKGKRSGIQTGLGLGVIGLCFALKYFYGGYSLAIRLAETAALAIYVRLCFSKEYLHKYMCLFMLYVILDLIHIVIAITGFPVMLLLHIKPHTLGSELLVLALQTLFYTAMAWASKCRQGSFLNRMSVPAQMGMMFILAVIQCIIMEFRRLGYHRDHVRVYRLLLFAVGFGVIVLILWGYDKLQERKRIQELSAYEHHTREIIPSMGRALRKIGELSEHMELTKQIVDELRAICEADGDYTASDVRSCKSFESTGIVALDLQLEGYLEEAEAQDFTLDIIVRAPAREILETENIELYSLLQIVGDLYRNANKIVRKNEKDGRILICFGYNAEGFYELSVYDNGEPFPDYILEHLGERGVTTDGTGHGIPDVMETLHRSRESFLIDQTLPKGSIFTKGICIIFDGRDEKTIKCR